ncbi:hypothetical protein FOT63_21970 [Serratia ureilytica]|uniref:Uncharacterized protein n=1 Tax=Serratia ureilytica TaxID=300181 RepID=A0A9X9BZJ5_9GAMM|nr:hypothetical protein FOT63_21970 [Serratia ureilytica]
MNAPPAPAKLVSPANVSHNLHILISTGRASYLELQERLSARDMFNLLEVVMVEAHNEAVWRQYHEKKR